MTTDTRQRARSLCQRATDAERLMWAFLRDRRLHGYKFRRQQVIGPYIVDFVSLAVKLVVELDGGQHANRADYDERRTRFLESKGYRVVRYWDHEMLLEPEQVLDDVLRHLKGRSPHPVPSGIPTNPKSCVLAWRVLKGPSPAGGRGSGEGG